jgi:hypothetical protein
MIGSGIMNGQIGGVGFRERQRERDVSAGTFSLRGVADGECGGKEDARFEVFEDSADSPRRARGFSDLRTL